MRCGEIIGSSNLVVQDVQVKMKQSRQILLFYKRLSRYVNTPIISVRRAQDIIDRVVRYELALGLRVVSCAAEDQVLARLNGMEAWVCAHPAGSGHTIPSK